MKLLNHLRAILRITRLIPSLIAGLLTGFIVYKGTAANFGITVKAGLAMFLVTVVGFIADNIYDEATDRLSGTRNPIASGLVSKLSAVWATGVLIVTALMISPETYSGSAVLAATTLGLLMYPILAGRFPLLKGVYTALLVCAPLAYGMYVGHIHISAKYYLVLAVFVTGREAFLDSYQSEADRAFGIVTVAVRWSKSVVERYSGYMMVIASVLLIIISQGHAARTAATICFVTVAAILYSPIKTRFRPGLLRLSMLLGAIAIGLSV